MTATPKVAAIVPLNRLDRAKTRLAEVPHRVELTLSLARGVLRALAHSCVGEVALVSPQADLSCLADEVGFHFLLQTDDGLNQGLELGRRWAIESQADALLVVLADLPLLTGPDLDAIVSALEQTPVVLAPDQDELGTNLMAFRPLDRIRFEYGHGSFARHLAQAGVNYTVVRRPGTRQDLDTPAHLESLSWA
ncbi:MAG: 2-phospho-L-lactate guanylyltransferase [Vulcanimicrobiota bacterium]